MDRLLINKRKNTYLRRFHFTISLIFLALNASFGQCYERADSLYQLAEQAYKSGDLASAGNYFMATAEVEYGCDEMNYENLSMELTNAAFCFEAVRNIPLALSAYSKLYKIAVSEGDTANVAMTYLSRAKLYMFTSESDLARSYADSAFNLYTAIVDYSGIASSAELLSDQLQFSSGSDTAFSFLNKQYRILREIDFAQQEASQISEKLASKYKQYMKPDSAIYYYNWSLDYYLSETKQDKISELALELGNLESLRQNKVAALEYYGVAHEAFVLQGDNLGIAICLNQRGKLMADLGRIYEGLEDLSVAERLFIENKHNGGLASVKSNRASVFRYTSQYDSALVLYNQSLQLFQSLNDRDNSNRVLNNIANIYIAKSEYQKAANTYLEALDLVPENQYHDRSAILNGLGAVYSSWGLTAKALSYYNDALANAKASGSPERIAVSRNNIGNIYQSTGDYGNALLEFKEALKAYTSIGLIHKAIVVHINIGAVLQEMAQYELAYTSFENALSFAEQVMDKSSVSACNDYMATILQKQERLDEAEQLFLKAIEIRRQIGEREPLAHSLNNLAVLYIEESKYEYAVSLLEESVAIIELLRLDATEEARREYFSTQIFSYQNLIIAHVNLKSYDMAFYYNELSKSKQLADKISDGNVFDIPTLGNVQSQLSDGQIAFVFATTDIYDITQMVITNSSTEAVLQSKELFLRNLLKDDEIRKTVVAGLDIDEIVALKRFVENKDSVENLDRHLTRSVFYNTVKSYIELVNDPNYKNTKKARSIGQMLYQFLLAPFEDKLAGKEEILFITDGILSYLPFESLVDSHHKYVAQNANIRYLHSFTIEDLIGKRLHPAKRDTLIAFGVSDYSHTFSGHYTENVGSANMEQIQRQYWKWGNKKDYTPLYAALNYSRFSNLEYSKIESELLSSDFGNVPAYCNEAASEQNIKQMSASGELKNFRFLHFSAHGISVAEIPELSSLVLFPGEGEDGFFNINEIAELQLAADLVSLSACNTGIGRIYSGEGVVGIAQSFFIAGANALLATLWEVDEESTSVFMHSFYGHAAENGGDFSTALALTKNEFIEGKHGYAWTLPYFWAPFVLYGE